MTGKTHFIVGSTAALMITQPDDIKGVALTVAFAGIAAMYPDIDSPTSIIRQRTKDIISFFVTVIVILSLTGVYAAYNIAPITQDPTIFRIVLSFGALFGLTLIGMHCPHRGFTHSILCMGLILLCAALAGVIGRYMTCVLIGYGSHLFLDFFNKKGEQLLFPVPIRCCLHLCESDGIIDTIMMISGYILSATYIIQLIPQENIQAAVQVVQKMW